MPVKASAWAIGLGVLVLVGAFAFRPLPPGPSAAVNAPSSAATRDDDLSVRRYVAAKFIANGIKKTLNDPDSIQWDDLYTNKDGTVVCAEYRARNAFNGMVRKFVSFTRSGESESISAWNKHCTGKEFFSEKYVVGLW